MAPYLHQFSAKNLHYIWSKFSIILKQINAGTPLSKGSILDEISEQHQNQSRKKAQHLKDN